MSETTSFPGDATSAAAPTDISRRNIRRATVAAMIGTIIEWYDYALYGAASGIVINRLFFPNLSPLAGVLAAFATFAVGYFRVYIPNKAVFERTFTEPLGARRTFRPTAPRKTETS